MPEATPKELQESIDELTAYRDRLQKEVVSIAQKLKMPPKKIDLSLEENSELKKIEMILSQLIEKLDRQMSVS